MHPVHVAAHGVDFAVVGDVAERMRQLPGGKRVGREALVHQAERAGHVGVGQLVVEVRDLRREQQAFIDDGARRERGNVEHRRGSACPSSIAATSDLGALADDVELALELIGGHALPRGRRRSARYKAARRAPRGRWRCRRSAYRASREPSVLLRVTMRSMMPSAARR